jgi:dTDP-4-dehydrorhamnose reductase
MRILSNPEGCAQAIHDFATNAVINAAAHKAVDKAEEEEGLPTVSNGPPPHIW